MNGAEDHVVVVELGRAGVVGAGGGRVEREVGEERAEARGMGGDRGQLLEVAQADGAVGVVRADERRDGLTQSFGEDADVLLSAARCQRGDHGRGGFS